MNGETTATPSLARDAGGFSARRDRLTLNTIAACLVIAAASWYLLQELGGVLRPLLLAILVGYVLLPVHKFLTRWLPGLASVALLAGAAAAIFWLLALMLAGSAGDLKEELPHLVERAEALGRQAQRFATAHLPPWLAAFTGGVKAKTEAEDWLREQVNIGAHATAAALTGALVIGVYLLFLLMEAGDFSSRVRRAFPEARADQILKVMASINTAMADYLRIKVQANLVLAAPVMLILWILGVQFALMWGLLTFVANFIPYVGSIVACSLPVLFAFLELDFGWRPVAVAVLLPAVHLTSANLVEPAMTGRVVGLSPLVVLIALAFWGQCWGLTGMILAVPLTVMLKIVLENLAVSRPLARLLAE